MSRTAMMLATLAAIVFAGFIAPFGCAKRKPAEPARTSPAAQPDAPSSPAPQAETPSPTGTPDPAPAPTTPPTTPSPAATPTPLRELFPFVRADIAAQVVEFDGIVPIDCHHPDTPIVYLELVACTPDTREHESLVMTRAAPSHIHAALLAVGLVPGKPGSWKWEARRIIPIPPDGDALSITISYRDPTGVEISRLAQDWIIHAETGAPFLPRDGSPARWLFSGSVFANRQGNELYDADGTGTLIGLCTFGSEVIAWPDPFSPEAAIDEPIWIANNKLVPKAGTPVVVRLRAKP